MALVWLFGPDLSRLAYWSDALHAAAHDAGIVPSSSLSANATVTADVCIYDLGPRRHADIGALLSAVEHHAGPRFVAMSARPDAEEGLALLRGGVRGYVNRMANARVLEAVVEVEGDELALDLRRPRREQVELARRRRRLRRPA